jgi:hypothetical protein
MSAAPALAPDAAMVLGIASTAMPFALTPEAEAERWLRLLRLHGEVGAALQALGIGEEPLRAPGSGETPAQTSHEHDDRQRIAPTGSAGEEADRDAVAQVTAHAGRIAERRGADGIATADVLMAVMEVYGDDFDRLLGAYGTDRDEVLQALGARTTQSRRRR